MYLRNNQGGFMKLRSISNKFKSTVEPDKTFIPTALNPDVTDDREPGVQVFFLYFYFGGDTK